MDGVRDRTQSQYLIRWTKPRFSFTRKTRVRSEGKRLARRLTLRGKHFTCRQITLDLPLVVRQNVSGGMSTVHRDRESTRRSGRVPHKSRSPPFVPREGGPGEGRFLHEGSRFRNEIRDTSFFFWTPFHYLFNFCVKTLAYKIRKERWINTRLDMNPHIKKFTLYSPKIRCLIWGSVYLHTVEFSAFLLRSSLPSQTNKLDLISQKPPGRCTEGLPILRVLYSHPG